MYHLLKDFDYFNLYFNWLLLCTGYYSTHYRCPRRVESNHQGTGNQTIISSIMVFSEQMKWLWGIGRRRNQYSSKSGTIPRSSGSIQQSSMMMKLYCLLHLLTIYKRYLKHQVAECLREYHSNIMVQLLEDSQACVYHIRFDDLHGVW